MHLIRRLPALLAAIVLACAPAAPLVFASAAHGQAPAADAAKPAEATPKAPPPPVAKEKETIEEECHIDALGNPLGLADLGSGIEGLDGGN